VDSNELEEGTKLLNEEEGEEPESRDEEAYKSEGCRCTIDSSSRFSSSFHNSVRSGSGGNEHHAPFGNSKSLRILKQLEVYTVE